MTEQQQTPAIPDALSKELSPAQISEAEAHLHGKDQNNLDIRFADPLIATIVEAWRARQACVRAQRSLTLQIKAVCRRFTGGDKKEANVLYRSMQNGQGHPLAERCHWACAGLLDARRPLEAYRTGYEKQLLTLGKQLPIAHMADNIRGVNATTLATIAAECGDLSAYEKGVLGVWKRAGLAVMPDGTRQRCVSGDAAIEHGYSPERRAVFYNIGASLLRAQGTGEDAGPYRQFYDREKARIRPMVETDRHAHNRAMRHMTKLLLENLTKEWRRGQRAA